MKNPLHHIFIEHPESVDETYFEHLRFASGVALKLLAAAAAAFAHALVPVLFQQAASRKVGRLHEQMHRRKQ